MADTARPPRRPGNGNGRTTFTASPFVAEIEPITASTTRCAATWPTPSPPLLPALAYATGDMSLLRDDLRPDPMLLALPQGGLTDEQQAASRAGARGARSGSATAAARPAPIRRRRRAADHGVRVGGAEMADYLPLLEEELAYRGEDRRAPDGTRTTWRRRRLPGADHRRRHVGPARRPPPATGRGRLRDRREERRRRRHLVREQVSGLPGRQPQPQLQLLLRPAPRLAAPLLHPGRAARLLERVRRRLRGARPHPLRTEVLSATWSDDDAPLDGAVRTPDGEEDLEAHAVVSAVGQLNRPSTPRSRASAASRARRSTRPGGTTRSTWPASGWR